MIISLDYILESNSFDILALGETNLDYSIDSGKSKKKTIQTQAIQIQIQTQTQVLTFLLDANLKNLHSEAVAQRCSVKKVL